MRWQDAAKILGASGTIGVIALFSVLFNLAGVSYTHSGDSFGTPIQDTEFLETEAYVNVSTWYWNICFENTSQNQYIYLPEDTEEFEGTLERYKVSDLNFSPILYKKATYGRKLWVNLDQVDMIVQTEPQIPVQWKVPTYGNNWRNIKDGDCWLRGETNENKLVGKMHENQTVKWSFILGDEIDIDPIWFGKEDLNQLSSNTESCRNDCETVYELTNPTNKTICDSVNLSWINGENLKEYSISTRSVENYNVTLYNVTRTCENITQNLNDTIINTTNCTIDKNYYNITKEREIYTPIENVCLESGYKEKLYVKGSFKDNVSKDAWVDNIICFNNFCYPEYAVWTVEENLYYDYYRMPENENKVWIKGNWTTGETKRIYWGSSESYEENGYGVFYYFDNFNGTNSWHEEPGLYVDEENNRLRFDAIQDQKAYSNDFNGITNFKYFIQLEADDDYANSHSNFVGLTDTISWSLTNAVVVRVYGGSSGTNYDATLTLGAWNNSNYNSLDYYKHGDYVKYNAYFKNLDGSTYAELKRDSDGAVLRSGTVPGPTVELTNLLAHSRDTQLAVDSNWYNLRIAKHVANEPTIVCNQTEKYCDVTSTENLTDYEIELSVDDTGNLSIYEIVDTNSPSKIDCSENKIIDGLDLDGNTLYLRGNGKTVFNNDITNCNQSSWLHLDSQCTMAIAPGVTICK